MKTTETGSTYVVLMILLLLISVLFIGISTYAHMVARTSVMISEKQDLKQRYVKEAERVVRLMAQEAGTASESAAADSRHDDIWNRIQFCEIEGAKIGLEDVSSRLNPNWMMRTLFTRTKMHNLFSYGKTADELQQFRQKQGISVDIASHYRDFFSPENLEKYFSGYGYFNINVTDEFILATVYRERTGKTEGEAEGFRLLVHNRRLEKEPLKRIIPAGRLREFLRDDYEALYPIINAEPLFNVNFVPEDILREIITYPYTDQGDNKHINPAAADLILQMREQRELTEKDLENTIKPRYKNARIGQFLGARTWFWKITIAGDHAALVWIVARIPDDQAQSVIIQNQGVQDVYFTLIDERFSE
jgi:hypothetical protein